MLQAIFPWIIRKNNNFPEKQLFNCSYQEPNWKTRQQAWMESAGYLLDFHHPHSPDKQPDSHRPWSSWKHHFVPNCLKLFHQLFQRTFQYWMDPQRWQQIHCCPEHNIQLIHYCKTVFLQIVSENRRKIQNILLKYSYHESKTIFTSCMIHEGSFKLVIINLSSNHTCWSFLSIFIFFEDSMSGCHHGGSLVSDVNGDREDETVWIV